MHCMARMDRAMGRDTFTRPGCSKHCPTYLWALPGMGQTQLFWEVHSNVSPELNLFKICITASMNMKDRKLFCFYSWIEVRSRISKIFSCTCTSEINLHGYYRLFLSVLEQVHQKKKKFKWGVSKQPCSSCFHSLSAKTQRGTELQKTCINLNVCILLRSVLPWGRLRRAMSRLCLGLLRLFLLLTKYLNVFVVWKPNYLAIHRQGLEEFPV